MTATASDVSFCDNFGPEEDQGAGIWADRDGNEEVQIAFTGGSLKLNNNELNGFQGQSPYNSRDPEAKPDEKLPDTYPVAALSFTDCDVQANNNGEDVTSSESRGDGFSYAYLTLTGTDPKDRPTFEASDNDNNGIDGGEAQMFGNSALNAVNYVIKLNGNGQHGVKIMQLNEGYTETALDNCIFEANNNGYYGALLNRDTVITDSELTVNNNSHDGLVLGNAFKMRGSDCTIYGNGQAGIDYTDDDFTVSESTVDVQYNKQNGFLFSDQSGGTATFEESVDLTIMNNGLTKVNDGTVSVTGYNGGGIRTCIDVILPSDAVIYNNHAQSEGDDISCVSDASITIGSVGENWTLDGITSQSLYMNTCEETITGWYDDGQISSRWNAHPTGTQYMNIVEYAPGTYEGVQLKAAHGLTLDIEPADMIIYTGGEGYESGVQGSGDDLVGQTTNGLPEPGFYITLPEDVNTWLLNHLGEEPGTVLDLSQYLTFTYADDEGRTRLWKLERYDNKEGNDSMALDRYIYRILPYEAEDGTKIPIRLEFTDDEGNSTISDNFTVATDEVVKTYGMSIYDGGLNQDFVKAQLKVPYNFGDGFDEMFPFPEYGLENTLDVNIDPGTLSVRGTTTADAPTTTVINKAPTEQVDNVQAEVPADTKFYINESPLEVAEGNEVKLLVDSIVSDPDNTMQNAAIDEFEEITADQTCELKYLDLVDTDNGNAWVTTNDVPLTVHWPVPEDATDDSTFYIVHYPDLDRDNNEALESGNFTQELYSVENGKLKVENGNITFTVDSFSPFALFYTAEEEPDNPSGPVIVPDDPDEEDPDTPTLNTEDHYSYIVGYPEDYRTGEATDDESLWPVKPQGNITRAEVATIFYRLLTNDARSENWTTANDYTDVAADSWYNTPVSTLSAMGIVRGYEDGSFRPNASITRAEFAAIAVRFFESDAVNYEEGLFTDIAGSEWFADAVQAAKDHDIIGGYPDGTFKPNNPITRAEACSIVNRTTKRVPDADHLLALDEMRNWPDNANTAAWYYADMQEATNGHYYDYVLDDNEEIVREEWTSAREPIDWDQVEAELEASH